MLGVDLTAFYDDEEGIWGGASALVKDGKALVYAV